MVEIPKFNWMMGTGLYIDDIAKEVASIRLKVTRNIRNTFFTVVVILAGTIIVIALVGIAINMHASQLADKRLRELAHSYVQFQVSQRRIAPATVGVRRVRLNWSPSFRIASAWVGYG